MQSRKLDAYEKKNVTRTLYNLYYIIFNINKK